MEKTETATNQQTWDIIATLPKSLVRRFPGEVEAAILDTFAGTVSTGRPDYSTEAEFAAYLKAVAATQTYLA